MDYCKKCGQYITSTLTHNCGEMKDSYGTYDGRKEEPVYECPNCTAALARAEKAEEREILALNKQAKENMRIDGIIANLEAALRITVVRAEKAECELEDEKQKVKNLEEYILKGVAFRDELQAAKEKAEGALRRAREVLSRARGLNGTECRATGNGHLPIILEKRGNPVERCGQCLYCVIDAALSSTSPCPHEEELTRLQEENKVYEAKLARILHLSEGRVFPKELKEGDREWSLAFDAVGRLCSRLALAEKVSEAAKKVSRLSGRWKEDSAQYNQQELADYALEAALRDLEG